MKIALIQCPVFSVRMPQLGPAYLKGDLEKNGHEVIQFDFNIALYNSVDKEYKKYWGYEFEAKWTADKNDCSYENIKTIEHIPFLSESVLENWAKDIIQSNADLIGFTAHFSSINTSVLLARKIKELDREKKIIFGGPFILCNLNIRGNHIISINAAIRNLLHLADMVAVGEGEGTILEVAQRLENHCTIKKCQGVIARENGSIIVNKLRPLIVNLDSLPFPNFSILDTNIFADKNFLPILATRGCPNRCCFCDFPYLDRYKLRIRGAANIVEEIKFQIKKYNTELFHFNDSTINANVHFLSELCHLIIKEGISIRWGASASINTRMDKVLFDTLKQSGCEYLSFGIESASQKVLRDMGKNFTLEDAERNLIDCHNSGIAACTNWIMGFPTEGVDDFEETLFFIGKNRKYISEIEVALFTIKPHTYMYEHLNKYHIELNATHDWRTKDNLNTYEERLRRLRLFWKKENGRIHPERLGGTFDNEITSLFR